MEISVSIISASYFFCLKLFCCHIWLVWLPMVGRFVFEDEFHQLANAPSYIQGVPWELSKSACLWESLKIQNMSWNWCFHYTEIGPLWDLILKKFHNHSVIIHLWRFWRLIFVKICRIPWISRIKQMPVLFCKYLRNESLRNFIWWSITIFWAFLDIYDTNP